MYEWNEKEEEEEENDDNNNKNKWAESVLKNVYVNRQQIQSVHNICLSAVCHYFSPWFSNENDFKINR